MADQMDVLTISPPMMIKSRADSIRREGQALTSPSRNRVKGTNGSRPMKNP
jgi:hypothetical protein